MSAFKNIRPDELEERMEAGLDGELLDVRTPAEVSEARIPGSLHIDIHNPEFTDKVKELDKSKTYYVYCRSGGRSANACMQMSELGFNDLYNLAGGITEWTGATESD